MLHVLLTVKPSRRFPGKNRLLWPYTYLWLLAEAAAMEEAVQLYVVGEAGEVPQPLPRGVRYLPIEQESHRRKVALAEEAIAPAADDVLVLAQLTQPLRERGLLSRVAEMCRRSGQATVTATAADTHDWRVLTFEGEWSRRTDDVPCRLLDGALYAWQRGHAGDIFTAAAPHAVVLRTRSTYVVDVDTPADLPPGLPAAWAELMTEETHNQD